MIDVSNHDVALESVGGPGGPRGFRRYWTDFRKRISDGGPGVLPVLIGLAIIWSIFQALNPFFLSAANLVNLALECAAIGTIAIGVVLVLLIAQIDLSVGTIGGLSSAIVAFGFILHGWPLWLSVVLAILAAAVIGLFYGLIFTRFGVPSFVITLAGLMGFLGLQLWILGTNGSINIPFDSWLVTFAQQMFLAPAVSYALVAVAAALYGVSAFLKSRRRASAGLSATSSTEVIVKASLLLVLLGVVAWYLNTSRGIGLMFFLFLLLIMIINYALTRTRWGRNVYAIGGNVEAARRAGINVNRVIISVFILGTTLASLGGILATARLASAGVSSGGGDTNLVAIAAAVIGGTSLFGGRGNAWSALLGIVVIQSIASGLTLLSLDSSIRFMITGAVLLLAVTVDSLSRRSRAAHGKG
ncbi:sugar ABC transporter permease [Specibacter sp. RAF43]|uniref:sugar ABC transporter permease n=1 Tax=Specibacter sp. RAF43 TaxID=3233057 RepID=UPI003F967CF5